MNQNVAKILGWILNNKLVTLLGVALLAFFISTVVLSSQKSSLESDLEHCLKPAASATTTTTSTTAASSTTNATMTPTTTKPEITQAPTAAPQVIDYRLHKHIRPIEYDLLLHPNLETGQFKGIVKIALNISAPANEIRLHSHKLTITSIAVVGDSGHELKNTFHLSPREEFLVIKLDSEIKPSTRTHSVTIRYEGDMNNRIVGFYRSVYKNGTQNRHGYDSFGTQYFGSNSRI